VSHAPAAIVAGDLNVEKAWDGPELDSAEDLEGEWESGDQSDQEDQCSVRYE
jgi:hypothetical protein